MTLISTPDHRPRPLNAKALDALLAGAREIYVSGCSAAIPDLPALLGPATRRTTVTGIFSPILNTDSLADPELERRCRTFFLNPALRRDLARGLVDFCPWSYSAIARWLAAPGRFDTALVMVSPPDDDNLCSFGTQHDFLPDFLDRIPRVIGIVNPNMPRTMGSPGIPVERFAALLQTESAIPEYRPDEGAANALGTAIAQHVAGLIPDGATVQLGIGRASQGVTQALGGHRRIRLHTGLIDDNLVKLERAGALDPQAPIVTGVAMGTRDLYDLIDGNPRFRFLSASRTHALQVLAQLPVFIAVNSALQVDLFGQINSEGSEGRVLASPGGLPEFVRGARQSPGGLSIFALRAKPGRQGAGGIVPRIAEPGLVTAAAHDVDVVATENGIADLRGLSLDGRAEALIAVADPAVQPELVRGWAQVRAAAFG
ncbi:acetyl-CoA hydrolase/transferase family protein [Alterinioella nitratireducens]|uniref:acetyl-CoA hydrolase/transferase family protein n=1 Tax=Alterinioella nitratireducens TaxID=2735915 RepID=UPI00155266BE|nr:acetyl-CoA hydrolase/transferase C-terminal domain-containing protein [Alterinioella nitratireducens]NPD21492.1 4-hydroxybutyrate CoA-transferase [Alterinioella nitratireducens]